MSEQHLQTQAEFFPNFMLQYLYTISTNDEATQQHLFREILRFLDGEESLAKLFFVQCGTFSVYENKEELTEYSNEYREFVAQNLGTLAQQYFATFEAQARHFNVALEHNDLSHLVAEFQPSDLDESSDDEKDDAAIPWR